MEYQFKNKDDLLRFMAEQVITTKEVAEILGVTRQSVNRLTRKGRIPTIKTDPIALYFRSDVEDSKRKINDLRSKYYQPSEKTGRD